MGMETTKGSRRGKERTRKSEAGTDRGRERQSVREREEILFMPFSLKQ